MAYSTADKKKEYDKAYNARPGVKKIKSENYKKWAAGNKEKLKQAGATRRRSSRGACLVANCRTRARNKNIPFDLDNFVDDIQKRIDHGRCELTGVAFDMSPTRHWNSPSIDRIRPRDGYVAGNIRIVCHAINAAMGDWGEEIVWEMLKTWEATKAESLC